MDNRQASLQFSLKCENVVENLRITDRNLRINDVWTTAHQHTLWHTYLQYIKHAQTSSSTRQ